MAKFASKSIFLKNILEDSSPQKKFARITLVSYAILRDIGSYLRQIYVYVCLMFIHLFCFGPYGIIKNHMKYRFIP